MYQDEKLYSPPRGTGATGDMTPGIDSGSDFDFESAVVVPASSSPTFSSPFPTTTPPNNDAEPSCIGALKPRCSLALSMTAVPEDVNNTLSPDSEPRAHSDRSTGTDSDRSDLGCSKLDKVDDQLADDTVHFTPTQSAFVNRLHELLVVVQREREKTASLLASLTPSRSARSVECFENSFTSGMATPPCVDMDCPQSQRYFDVSSSLAPKPLAAAGPGQVSVSGSQESNRTEEITNTPDYWSTFSKSASAAYSSNSAWSQFSRNEHAGSGAYGHSGSTAGYTPSQPLTSEAPSYECDRQSPIPCNLKRRASQSDLGLFGDAQSTSGGAYAHPTTSIHPREPRTKRLKKSSLDVALGQRGHASDFQPHVHMYAHRAASLRRAESLRSEAADDDEDEDTRSSSSTPLTPYAYVPTEPTTPASVGERHAHRRRQLGRLWTPPRSPLPNPLPIIAPPSFEEIPSAPLSEEDAAERGVRALLEREKAERTADGLFLTGSRLNEGVECTYYGDNEAQELVESSQDVSGSSEDEQVRMILRRRHSAASSHSADAPTKSIFSARQALNLGVDEDIRVECIDWILEVLPDIKSRSTRVRKDLHDQLWTYPETRWHAAQLFTRYFMRVGSLRSTPPTRAVEQQSSGKKPLAEDAVALLAHEGREAVTWDIAVACIALSVKFHRDVFLPFYMIPAHEFGALAPHTMSYDDLENAQRDVLDALSHSVGIVTPGQYLQDLWAALPCLRGLLAFEGAWEAAQEETWAILLEAFMQPDVLRFPTSLLTACALVDGTIDVLIERYRVRFGPCNSCKTSHVSRPSTGKTSPKSSSDDLRKKASIAVQSAQLDMQELLGYTEVDFRYCRLWLRSAT